MMIPTLMGCFYGKVKMDEGKRTILISHNRILILQNFAQIRKSRIFLQGTDRAESRALEEESDACRRREFEQSRGE